MNPSKKITQLEIIVQQLTKRIELLQFQQLPKKEETRAEKMYRLFGTDSDEDD